MNEAEPKKSDTLQLTIDDFSARYIEPVIAHLLERQLKDTELDAGCYTHDYGDD